MDRGDYTEPVIEPCSLGAKEAAVRIERGELSARSLIESCLERIGEDARTLAAPAGSKRG